MSDELRLALEAIDRDMGERDLWQASYALPNGERLEVRRDISLDQGIPLGEIFAHQLLHSRRWCKRCLRTTAHDADTGACSRCATLDAPAAPSAEGGDA